MNVEEAIEIVTNAIQTGSLTAERDRALAVVQKTVEKVITGDVVPVVHGRWIRFKETDPETGYIHMKCSVCSAYWSDPSHADHFRYCPNCGAKMDRR